MTFKDMRKKQEREKKGNPTLRIELAALQLELEEKIPSITIVGVPWVGGHGPPCIAMHLLCAFGKRFFVNSARGPLIK